MDAIGLHWWSFNIDLGNGLVLDSTKPLPQPILTKFCDAIGHHQGPMGLVAWSKQWCSLFIKLCDFMNYMLISLFIWPLLFIYLIGLVRKYCCVILKIVFCLYIINISFTFALCRDFYGHNCNNLLHVDDESFDPYTTQAKNYPGKTRSIFRLLMPWLLVSPGQQQLILVPHIIIKQCDPILT